jgi:tRNA (guanine-N7-)-methyltransferase
MPRVRVHQHVNPLAPRFQQISPPVDFAAAFADPSKPLHMDIGSARGRFLLKMAPLAPDWNFLGVEIRELLVEEANRIKDERSLDNLYYKYCNATISLGNVLKDLPEGILQMVTIQFPDPCFKKKHFKRRMVKVDLIAEIAKYLAPGGKVFVQSDVEEIKLEICDLLNQHGAFTLIADDIKQNPLPVKTEREISVEARYLPVYRAMFERK